MNPANTNTKTNRNDGVIQRFTWINDITYCDSRKREFSLNILECREKVAEVTTYRWITSFEITQENVNPLGNTARCRWKIENQGFNTQKNLGFELEHPYSEDQVGMKVYYYLLQIAHIWVQLCERGSLLRIAVPEGFGALKNVAFRLLEEWRIFTLFQSAWEKLHTIRIQIRLDTS